jgi:eukaryotic-like serine/threonine-protein kinase
MKTFFRFVLLALTLLVVALVSALTAMRFAIHGREVAVPDLVGKTPLEARRAAELNGFQFEIERQYYSANIPEGRILLQIPPAGTQIRRGWQIRVAESLGPQRVEIPNLLGESERAAEFNILRRGLDVGAVAQIEMPSVPADQVIAQSPSPSAASIAAPKISLLSAQPSAAQAFVMPSFVGQTLASATEALRDAGLRVGNVTLMATGTNNSAPGPSPAPSTAPPAPGSVIVSQDPPAGGRVVAGTAVNFEVR